MKVQSQSSVAETAGLVGNLVRQARLVWRLLQDRRVPGWLKLIPAAAVVYFLSPIDLLPDLMLPGLGELDDIAILFIALKTFLELAPPGVVREHLEQIVGRPRGEAQGQGPGAEPPIDVPYRLVEKNEQERRTQ
jgi:uncharacterized membrane protein YkvA (DUF1232 family)